VLLQDCNFWNLTYATRLAPNTIQNNIDTHIRTCTQVPLHQVPTTNKPYIKLTFNNNYIYCQLVFIYKFMKFMWLQVFCVLISRHMDTNVSLNLLHYQHFGLIKFEWTYLFTLNYALLFIWSFFAKTIFKQNLLQLVIRNTYIYPNICNKCQYWTWSHDEWNSFTWISIYDFVIHS
jgi:hypothetical protein